MERLSGLDASFLYFETPQMHMHVCMCAIFDPSEMPGGYSFDKVQRLIGAKVHTLAPFRRRLVDVPFGLHHPVWIEDPDFDIIHHVRRVALPKPGGEEELGAICGRIASTPLDRSRPLWEVWVLEGLKDGRFAVLAKVHHAAVDGHSGSGLLVHLFSVQRDAALPDAPSTTRAESVPEDWDMVKDAVAARVRQPAALAKLAKKTLDNVAIVRRRRREADGPRGATPLTAPRTPFNRPLTARRNAAFAKLPLAGIKEIKRAHDAKVNDVIIAVVAGALRRYLDRRGELPKSPLVAVCPISVEPAGRVAGSNHVSGMFTTLATDIDDPAERLRTIVEATRGAKHEHRAIGADMLQNWAEFAAPTTFNAAMRAYHSMRLADRHRPIHNLVISNVPGPPFPLFMAGAQLETIYPLGPVMEGAGLNVTVLSYCGSIDFGFMCASDLMPDIWDLAGDVHPAFEELLAAS